MGWSSQKQKCVALSTTEGEYLIASEGVKETIWLNRLLYEKTGQQLVPYFLSDSANAIKLAKNSDFHKKTKHIDIRYPFIREKVNEGAIHLTCFWRGTDRPHTYKATSSCKI